MPLPMVLNEDTAVMLQQSFAKSHQLGLLAADQLANSTNNIAEQTRLGYLEGKEKVGVREAEAMRNMSTSKLAEQILQQRSAADQPNVAPSSVAPVVVSAPK